MTQRTLVFYHGADLDGQCSAAIVKLHVPDAALFAMDYGDPFPWNLIEPTDKVFMLDFSLPVQDMFRLREMDAMFVWIDHHSSKIDELEKDGFWTYGIRSVGEAACELTWKYLYDKRSEAGGKLPPLTVHLLSRYDVWDHSDPDILPFQYRMRTEDMDPRKPTAMKMWKELFEQDGFMSSISEFVTIRQLISEGELILRYEQQYLSRYAAIAYPGILSVPMDSERTDLFKVLAINKGFVNSTIFESIPNRYDFQLWCCYVIRNDQVKVTLYRPDGHDKPNVGRICKAFGGGGHDGVGGFNVHIERWLRIFDPADKEGA